jgi:carboxyl-terminal processing protease
LIVLISGGMGVYVVSDPAFAQAYTLARAVKTISKYHESDVDSGELTMSARRAIFERLDRYSGYLATSELDRLEEEFSGHYGGIGVSVLRHDQGLLIMSVRENGPAAEARLLAGDIIVAADSVEITGLSFDHAAGLLRGEDVTTVLVKFVRPSTSDTVEVSVMRRRIPFVHVAYAGFTPDSLVYIRLLDFEAGASADVRAALDSLVIEKHVKPQGLILDLRGNPGGLLTEAYETADLFLEKGTFIVGTDARSRWNEKRYHARGYDLINGAPMAAIVDRGTASSAEIVAGALKQAGRAILVGDTTFGKGLVQGFIRFPDGDGLKLTIARYYFANGIYLNDFDTALNDIGHGIVPDYHISFAETQPFPQALENSMLFLRFAEVHQDEIIADFGETGKADLWIGRFASFSLERNFVYKSPLTKLSESFCQLTEAESRFPESKDLAAKILHFAMRDDQKEFSKFADYIIMRLREISWERKLGTYRAYRDVIVPGDSVIRFASTIIVRKP